MDRKLTRKDLITIAIALVVTAGAIVFLKHNMRRAFPEISLKFSIERDEATRKAAQFLEDMGFDITDYHKTTVFSSDYLPRLYIDKELGPEYLKVYADSGIRLWFWTSRFFKPLSKREYYVEYDPVTGELKGFKRELEDEAEGASLDADSAQRIALAFLGVHADFDPSEWRLVKSNVIKRPNRLDHEFVWERKNFKIKDATYRMRVVVQGNQVGIWEQFVKVPEAWERNYRKMRSYNNLLQSVTNAIFILMALAMLYVLVARWRRRQIDWKVGLSAGGFIAAISFITMVNRLPLMVAYSYDTMSSLTAFYLRTIAGFFFTSLLNGVITMVAFAAGESLYREVVSKRLCIRNFLSMRGFYTKEGFMAVLFGYMAATWFLTWVTAFYLVGKKFGFWSPADVEYSNIMNSYLPWVFALAAFLPAMVEEGIFRLFGVPFFKKITKSMALGLIIPAFIWGFLHSSYPVQPAYARGLEVGIGGIFFGILMLKMGIVSPIVLHYAVDAFFFAYYLFISKSLYLKIAAVVGVGIFAIPFIMSLIRYLKRGEFEPSESLINEANLPPSVEKVRVESVTVERREFPGSRKWGVIGISAFVIGVLLIALFRPYQLGHDLKVNLRPGDAAKISEDFLKSKGYDLKGYHGIAMFMAEKWDTQEVYMRVNGGFSVVDSFFKRYRPSGAWSIRWFKPLETEEFNVRISETRDGSGKPRIYQFEHTLPETAAGANLTLDSAKVLAAQYLYEHGFNLEEYQLYKSESEKREHRTDHELGWESREPFTGEARVRLDVTVQGDEPEGPDIYLKVPEKWIREFYRKTAWDSIRYILRTVLMLIWVALTVFFVVKALLSNRLDYKVGFKYLLVGVIFTVLDIYSVLPGVIARLYYTAMPYTNFVTTYISSVIPARVILIAVAFLLAWLAAYRRHRIRPIDAAVTFGLGILFIGVTSLLEWLRFRTGLAITSVHSLSTTPIWERLPFVSTIDSWLTSDLLKLSSIFVLFAGLLKDRDSRKWLKLTGILLLIAIVKASSTMTLTGAFGIFVVDLIALALLFAIWEYALKRDFALSMLFVTVISVLPVVLNISMAAAGLAIYGIGALVLAVLLTLYFAW